MKKFIVNTGNKKYKIEANSYDEAISAVKAIKNLEDSVKDAFVARLYKSPLDNQRRRVQLLLDGKEVASLTQNEARTLAAKILELANSATN